MKAVVQRVLSATVTVAGELVGETINPGTGKSHGLLVLLGVALGDSKEDSAYLAKKIAHLRIFEDHDHKMNQSVLEVEGSVLVVSQFTLLADWRKGRRPSFLAAAEPAIGERLYLHFASELKKKNVPVEMGIFGADMKVELINDFFV